MIASIGDEDSEVRTWPVNGALAPFKFGFDQNHDILLKSWQSVVIVKLNQGKGPMITAHNIEKREVMFSEIDRDLGPGFEVFI